ncbi:hypothetical protein [uncultured Cellulomonas sp.]|uniref:hypothetical protein n=1 Tax=uncultured Cellulomonas sp. TaxID=189682 RepID=UPI00262F2B51|nr:hypothetical protein [uncultured Cellulomonas sp.]
MDYDLRDGLRRLGDDPAVRTTRLPVGALTAQLRRRRIARTSSGAVVGTAAAVGVLVAGAAGLDRLETRPPAPVAAATPTTSTTPSPTPDPTTPVRPAPSPSSVAPVPTPSLTPTPVPPEPTPSSTPPAPVQPVPPTPPAAATPSHGGTAWGVYVAVMTTPDDPAWQRAGTRLEEMGYFPGGGDINCDRGAAEGLGLDGTQVVRSVYFTSRADAQLFVELFTDRYGDDVVGVVEVTTLCLD